MGEMDEYLLGEGTHRRIWQVLGAHVRDHEGTPGTHFAVWAPNAGRVSVVGDFNHWDGRRGVMRLRGATGVWEIFWPHVGDGARYKFEIIGQDGMTQPLKADPVGFGSQHPPETASIVRDIRGYGWKDDDWMATRAGRNARTAPISVYEVHLGSWRRRYGEGGRPLSYREAAEELVDYAHDMGFTHIELLPISEFPFDGSWGYQPVGLFAPTIRFGPPHEFRDLVDAAHAKGLGVLLDWVPGHFPSDPHGLARFDGTALYEHADPKRGLPPGLEHLHLQLRPVRGRELPRLERPLLARGIPHRRPARGCRRLHALPRLLAAAKANGSRTRTAGRENYEAIALLQRMNVTTYGEVPGIMTVAEESTSFPKVSAPVDAGGLGFGYKWNMGWMNDTLEYMKKDPIYRRHHHHQMTFGLHYAFSENFILPISHDEVVHGKGSMLGKMPGTEWEKFANLRAYYGFMWGHPGKKLLFMSCEFAQAHEWNHDAQIDWDASHRPPHAGIQRLVRDLNTLYRAHPALHVKDCEPDGFQLDRGERGRRLHLRLGPPRRPRRRPVAVLCNFTPIERPAGAAASRAPAAGARR
jgi:1,4-alpha-glucan branching enzyme